jgi:hypothetical protein
MKRWNKVGLCLLAGSLVILIGVRTGTGINEPTCNLPKITSQPTSQTQCMYGNASFHVTASLNALSYQWRKNGINISGATGSTLTLTSVRAIDAGPYSVVVANACGSVTSSGATLTVNAPPSITSQPTSQTKCSGQSASFSVTASGSSLSYQWRKNGSNIPGATSQTLTLNNVATSDAASYNVVVANSCGSATSTPATLTISGMSPSITSQPVSQTVYIGGSVSFEVTASGTPPLSYQWRKNGINISGATLSMLTPFNVTANEAGLYSARVSNPCGSVDSSAARLTVVPPPCSTPSYDTNYWDAEPIVMCNNCYNYANNVANNTFAQPGYASGTLITDISQVTGANIYQYAVNDGLVPSSRNAVCPDGMTKVALFVWLYGDFHWLRQDADGTWSQKMDSSMVGNHYQSSPGDVITDPETFCVNTEGDCPDSSPYVFYGYLCTCSSSEQGHGYANIRGDYDPVDCATNWMWY